MAIAVHRRAEYDAATSPYLQQEDDLTANMPVYTNIRKIHLIPFDTKFIVRKLFFYTDLFGNQNVYTYIHDMIQRITIDEAHDGFYTKPLGMPVQYVDAFTLSPASDGWEKVHYWIKRQRFEAQLAFNEGYIYILANKAMPGILKIGYTDRTPQHRVKEINGGTGVIVPWHIVNAFACKAPDYIESIIHKQLNQYNINKEGFAVTETMAVETVARIIEENQAGI